MRICSTILPLALALALPFTLCAAANLPKKEERVQIWQYQQEEPLEAPSLDPSVQSVRWREGDVEIIFTQAAPCGAWLPANPAWNVEKFNVVLNFGWFPQFPNTPEPTMLCKKYVRAWVFRVPRGGYQVRFGPSVPRFKQYEGKVFSLPGRQ